MSEDKKMKTLLIMGSRTMRLKHFSLTSLSDNQKIERNLHWKQTLFDGYTLCSILETPVTGQLCCSLDDQRQQTTWFSINHLLLLEA